MITVEKIIKRYPCYSRSQIEIWVCDGIPVSVEGVAIASSRGVSDEDIIWAACRLLPSAILSAWSERVMTRAINPHCRNCGVPEVETWAVRWLDGTDRTEAAQWAASAKRVWSAEECAWAATTAARGVHTRTEWAWGCVRAARARVNGTERAQWNAQVTEQSSQVEDLCEVLRAQIENGAI
jgi:hypothetical protein